MTDMKSMFPNMNLETGIHFGCISQNTLDQDSLMGLIDDSADVLYDSASDEFAEDLKTAMEEGTVLELLKLNYMDESLVDEEYDTIVMNGVRDTRMIITSGIIRMSNMRWIFQRT